MSSVLILPDPHAPCMHPNLVRHAKRVKQRYKCDTVLCLGDVLHLNALSFYEKYPDDPTAIFEYEQARKQLKSLSKAFPEMYVCYGNHDRRLQRKASAAGIPDIYLRDLNDVYSLPDTWVWDTTFEIDGVMYCHGDRLGGGMNPAFNQAKRQGKSVVAGHFHTRMGLEYTVLGGKYIFGMQVGCGIDPKHVLHQYNPKYMDLELVGVGVVVNGIPHLEPMPQGSL